MKPNEPLLIGNCQFSPIVVSTIMGHSGGGMFPLNLRYRYIKVMEAIRATGTTVIAKSATYERRIGNFRAWNPLTWRYIQRFGKDGLINAYGLTGPGVEVCARRIAAACRAGYRVIPSLFPFAYNKERTVENALNAITIYHHHLGPCFKALELNLSCPNAGTRISSYMEDALACVAAIKFWHPRLCLIAKISLVHPHEFSQMLVSSGADIIHAVNTIPYDCICPGGPPSPLADAGGGGVSGGPASVVAFDYCKTLRRKIPAPMIMGCGVMNLDGAKQRFNAGANMVSICTLVRLNPRQAIKVILNCLN